MKTYPPVEMNDFKLPVTVEHDSEYVSRASYELERYSDFVAANLNRDEFASMRRIVSDNTAMIKDSLKNYFAGKPNRAHSLIREYILKTCVSPFFIADINNNYAFRGNSPFVLRPSFYADDNYWKARYDSMLEKELSFFRARIGDHSFKREDMLHIPFDKREIIKNQRFSFAGIPCMYLSATSWGCWIEMDKPSQRKFNVSALRIPGNLRVLNLCIQQNLINGMSAMPDKKDYREIISLLEIFPLVIATSFNVKDKNERVFKSEYVISQLIMQVCLELGLDGVAYLSRQTDDMIAYPYAVNLALLMTGETESKYWPRACEVELTEPVRFSEFMMLPENERNISGREEYKSFVNEFYAKGRGG